MRSFYTHSPECVKIFKSIFLNKKKHCSLPPNKSKDATSALNDNKINADSLQILRDIHNMCLLIIDILSKYKALTVIKKRQTLYSHLWLYNSSPQVQKLETLSVASHSSDSPNFRRSLTRDLTQVT